MRLKDRLYMTPIKKYEKYGRYPWKLVVHMFLVVFTTCQVILIVNQSTTYAFSQYTLWNSLFLNHDINGSTSPIVNSFYLFSFKHVVTFIETSVTRYFYLNSHTIDNYDYEYLSDGTKTPAKLLINYINIEDALNKGYQLEYDLLVNDLGPFSSDIQDFLRQVKNFQIEFNLIHRLNYYIDLSEKCYKWKIVQKYDYSAHGTMMASLGTQRKSCGSETFSVFDDYIWINIIVLILSLISLWTVARYFMTQIQLVSSFTQGTSELSLAWQSLGLYEKLKFINMWVFFTMIGNFFQAFGSVLAMLPQEVQLTTMEAFIGLGCFCAWVGSVRFLNHTSKAYTMINTLDRAFTTIFPYIVGALPIFMAYVFFAISTFWEIGIYPNTYMAMIAAFAVVNGDSVYSFGSQDFVQNVFIAIIQVGYRSLAKNPPQQGDESDTEINEITEEKSKIEETKSKKKLSTLIASEKKERSELFGKNENLVLEKMDQLTEEIISLLFSLNNIAISAENSLVSQKFASVLTQEIEPVLEYFD